ncbi:DUF4091 domain-containing protein [Paenibacillus contaminans]|uniref:Glycoside hydrolase 123 catalytic domain-containing protein n=1 Tax=Paenibacillus contaminans TaxID=450362 RepID=A0A329MMA0_9BACL|nr:DUF4091 domain-containing protein [Paenibacillus contaminans]RAV20648.1 hypothetical protein DQG23_14130 [Paenibacillus contaminans]
MVNSSREKVFETRSLHSLVKVFADAELNEKPFRRATVLHNETYAFQVAYRSNAIYKNIQVKAISEIEEAIVVREVGLAPSEFPMYDGHDGDLLRETPGLFPDPLYPIGPDGVNALPNQWRSVWVSVEVNPETAAGIQTIEICFAIEDGTVLGSEKFELDVVPISLPEQRLIHTEWFHTDCIANYYGDEVFSDKHWFRVGQFVQTAAKHGMNMLLTPLFTPPLDTAVGGERPTVQLVDVEKDGDTYRFGFDKLKRWIGMADAAGIRYFEFSHLFTQWGAGHAPKIMASEHGEYKRIFGWETDAHGEAYKSFLHQFLPELVSFIDGNGLRDRSYFHVSDEPSMKHLESYRSAYETIKTHLESFPVIDALSDYDFYEKGLVKNPIPANNHIEPFLENDVPNLWTYYCCAQYKQVANRFFAFPSVRNRVLGLQLYKFRIAGFLHWGYNFWYSQYSKKEIDPFRVTDAGQGFPSGDAFLVYPGEEGPIESLRMEVFYEALQDLRALELLESRIGRDAVIGLIEEGLEQPLTFSEYPSDAGWLLDKREQINAILAKSL